MLKYISLTLIMLCLSFQVAFTQGLVTFHGQVKDENNESIPFALLILNDSLKIQTNMEGHFHKEVMAGRYDLKIQSVGFSEFNKSINLNAGEVKEYSFILKEDFLKMNEVVITGTRDYVQKQKAPVIVHVTNDETFDAVQAVSLAEGIVYQPGVRLETNCQNCGFTSLRINGLQGPYTQILINGRPVFSALNGVYGLEQIPAAMIERVEVVKGGGSALYGSNAIAGTVNVITKKPEENFFQLKSNASFIDAQTWDNSVQLNGAVISKDQKTGATYYGITRERNPYDANGDGFSELTELNNLSIGADFFYKPTKLSEITLDFYGISEERRGGNMFEQPPHDADIAEWLDHKILGAQTAYEKVSEDKRNRYSIYVSGQKTDRKSYYGAGGHVDDPVLDAASSAQDSSGFFNLWEQKQQALKGYGTATDYSMVSGVLFSRNIDSLFGRDASLVTGIENKWNQTTDRVPGYSRLTEQTVNNLGAYAQSSMKPLKNTTLLLGLRYDYNQIEGNYLLSDVYANQNSIDLHVLSPRINIMQDISSDLKFRVGYARGFRTPQAFDEDLHLAVVTGDLQFIVLENDLKPEISHAFTSSLVYTKNLNRVQMMFTADAFYTILQDVFVNQKLQQQPSVEYNLAVKRNGNGAYVRGVNLEVAAATSKNVNLQAGATLQESFYTEEETIWSGEAQEDVSTNRILRSPNFYGYATGILNLKETWDFTISGIYTGSMLTPHVIEPETQYTVLVNTPSFVEINLKAAKTFKFSAVDLELSAGIQNILNAYQSDFDRGIDRDPNYIYGPSRPRTFFVGLKIGNSI